MKTYFIGAGPGAADLITVRGAHVLSQVPIVLYAGSLVPESILQYCQPDTEIINTASLDIEQQTIYYKKAQELDKDVARLHSGDPAIYGAISEQIARLKELGISYEIIPGVSSFTGAAASLSTELTKPTISQTIILTRVSGRASVVPEKESLELLASHQATLCIFLSGPHLKQIVFDLRKHYSPQTPIALVYRATCPDEKILRSTLEHILNEIDMRDWQLTTMLIVGAVLDENIITESCLYSQGYSHRFRRSRK